MNGKQSCEPVVDSPHFKELHALKVRLVVVLTSVTRLGDLLHFRQPFKASGNNYFTQYAHIVRQFFKVSKSFGFSSEIIFGQLL